jgi:hypothetical protein
LLKQAAATEKDPTRRRGDRQMSRQWLNWFLKAVVAAVLVLGLGIFLLLGLPGALFMELAEALRLTPRITGDVVWPIAIFVTGVLGISVLPASLALRWINQSWTGWHHAIGTAALSSIIALCYTIYVVRSQGG